jgi:hypothetical protein
MQRKDDFERLDEMLARDLRRPPARFDLEQWGRQFPAEAKLAQSGFAQPLPNSRTQFLRIWRCIMESRYTKYTGLAAVLLVGLAFLFPGGRGLVPESIAWADVQKAMQDVRTARVTGTRNCFFGEAETPTYRLGVEKLLSLSYGCVDRTFLEDGRLLIELTYHVPTGTLTVSFPLVKRYYRMQVSAEYQQRAARLTPETSFEWMFASGDYRKVGPQEVQGIQAIGFEISNLDERLLGGLGVSRQVANFFFQVGTLSTRAWVNPQTRLPIRAEGEGDVKPCLITGFRPMRIVETNDCWQFEAELDEAQFHPTIPEDYQRLALPSTP